MPKIQTFDDLNNLLGASIRSLPFEKYFGDMRLTKEQKKERIELAKDIEDAVMFFLSMVVLQSEYAYMAAISSAEAKDAFRERMDEVIARHTEVGDDIRQRMLEFVDDVTDTTTEHLIVLTQLLAEEEPKTEPEKQAHENEKQSEQFYLSEDRARLLAEEESNTIFNITDYNKAKQAGYKYKEWITMRDPFVRDTHMRIDGKIIPIDDLFLVGESLMRFPRDTSLGAHPKEIIRCRCVMKFHK